MRTTDIVMGGLVLAHEMNHGMYLPASKLQPMDVADMTDAQLRCGLCQKSGGDVNVCKSCPGGCRWGDELVRRAEDEDTCCL